jgi:hypothetical protein
VTWHVLIVCPCPLRRTGRTIFWADYHTFFHQIFSPLCLSGLVVCKRFAACPKTMSYADCSEHYWPVIAGIGIVDCPGMPGMESSYEAPSHLKIPICFLPSLVEIIISSDVLIHLMKKLLQGLWWLPCKILSCGSWLKPLDLGLNDNLIRHCRRLSSQTQEPSDVRLQVLLIVLRALE